MSSVEDQISIQILHVPDCPLVGRVRELVRQALDRTNIQAKVEERVGDYPSPTLLIDGRDVTGRPQGEGTACRLDLPTEQQVLAALARESPATAQDTRRSRRS
jgi:hypothetical protein